MADTDNSSFADKVNAVVNDMKQDESGKWTMPEGDHDEAIVFAANAERRRRDTQSAYTKAQQENSTLKAERDLLAKDFEDNYVGTLPTSTQVELEELKATDPDAWHQKMIDIKASRQTEFQARRDEIATKAQGESEAAYRQRALQEFSEANPSLQLTNDVIKNDIPPRITRELEEGKVTFGEFLANVQNYLTKGKVIKQEDQPNAGVDLGSVPGSDHPDPQAQQKESISQYKDEIY